MENIYIYIWINGQKYFSYDYVITFIDFESISNKSSRTEWYLWFRRTESKSHCQSEAQEVVFASYSEMMTFLLNKEMFTCEVLGSSEYETNFFFSYCTAHYVISIHFRPLTMHLDFSNEIASGYEKKIQICVAFSWQDDLIKLFLSAHIFSPMQCKGIQWAKCSHPHKIPFLFIWSPALIHKKI